MNPTQLAGFIQPCDKLFHAARRIEGRRRLKHDAYHFALSVERSNIIAEYFVCAPVTLVLVAIAQQVAVELLDMVLCYGDVGHV